MRWALLGLLGACHFEHGQSGATVIDAAELDAAKDAPAIPSDAPTDAPADSAGFDPSMCPAGYSFSIGTSRYAIVATAQTFWEHDAACASTTTHLAVLSTASEAATLFAHLKTTFVNTTRFYVGGIQDPNAASENTGWIDFAGIGINPAMWSNFGTNGVEPDDYGDSFENRQEQALAIDVTVTIGYLLDVVGTSPDAAVCECDGKPVASAARAFVVMDPNNPN